MHDDGIAKDLFEQWNSGIVEENEVDLAPKRTREVATKREGIDVRHGFDSEVDIRTRRRAAASLRSEQQRELDVPATREGAPDLFGDRSHRLEVSTVLADEYAARTAGHLAEAQRSEARAVRRPLSATGSAALGSRR
jgi:hypothetical protein